MTAPEIARPLAPLALLASLALTGCSKMAIDGVVVDANGKPLAGAMISTVGTPCNARSGEDGKFSLECPPGSYQIIISAEGYTSEDLDYEATERKRYDLGKKVLIKIPDEKGLHLLQGGTYVQMTAGFLNRNLEKDGNLVHRSMCLDRERSQPNALAAGPHALFDYEHPGWRPFLLDADGCAYRDTKNEKMQWTVEYREKADYETREINNGKTIALMALKPGDYFIADWDKGFFTAVDLKEDRHSYTGYWIHVE